MNKDTQWANKKEVAELNELFEFNATGREQDWELEMADPSRIAEFLDAYITATINTPQRVAVMELIVASFDDLLSSGADDAELWAAVEEHLLSNVDLHRRTIARWSDGEPDEDNFPIVGRMQRIKRVAV